MELEPEQIEAEVITFQGCIIWRTTGPLVAEKF